MRLWRLTELQTQSFTFIPLAFLVSVVSLEVDLIEFLDFGLVSGRDLAVGGKIGLFTFFINFMGFAKKPIAKACVCVVLPW